MIWSIFISVKRFSFVKWFKSKFWENYVCSMNTAIQLTYSKTFFTYKRFDFILNFTIYFGSQFRLFIYLIFRIFRQTCSSQCCNVKKKRHEWHLIIHRLTVSLSKLRNTSVFFFLKWFNWILVIFCPIALKFISL